MATKGAVLLLLLTNNLLVIQSSVVGNIATIESHDGEVLGPYIIKDFHSHGPEQPGAVAQPLTGDEEGSGDYGALLGDTEGGGDDADAGLLTIQDAANNLQPKQGQAPGTQPESVSESSLKEESEWVFVGDFIPTGTPSRPSPNSEQPSEPSTPPPSTPPPSTQAPSTPPPSTPAPSTPPPSAPAPSTPQPPLPSTPAPRPPSTASPGCHESCVAVLEAVTLQVLPENVSFVRQGDGVRMTCGVSVTQKEQEPLLEQIQLNWLFQGEAPPVSECSLDGQPYLAECEGFASVWEEQQRNATHLQADILFTALAVHNTGRYLCQAVGQCCGSRPQRQLQHMVTVWQAAYTTPLAIMITASVLLAIMVTATVCYKRKLDHYRTAEYQKVFLVSSTSLPALTGKVLHLPLQQEGQHFDDRDSFSSADSAYA